MGRSNDEPALRTSAGARLTVIRCGGNSNPELRIALRTRSRLSRTLGSGRPTIVNEGRPNVTSTSTWTGKASMPKTAALRRQASTPDVHCNPPASERTGGNGSGNRAKEGGRRLEIRAESERVRRPAVASTAIANQCCGGVTPRGVRIVSRAPGISRSLFSPFKDLMDATVVPNRFASDESVSPRLTA